MIEHKQTNNSYCHEKPINFRACAIITCNIRILYSTLNFRSIADFKVGHGQELSFVEEFFDTIKGGLPAVQLPDRDIGST